MKKIYLLLLAIVATVSCAAEFEPSAQPEGITRIVEIVSPDALTKAALVAGDGARTVVWDAGDRFTVYNLTHGTSRTVTPAAISDDGLRASIPVTFLPDEQTLDVLISFGDVTFNQADSTLLAAAPLQQPLHLDGFNTSALPMASAISTVSSENPAPITLNPLPALVEMTIEGLPLSGEDRIRSVYVEGTPVKGTKVYSLTADNCCYKAHPDSLSIDKTSVLAAYKGDYANYAELSLKEPVEYGSAVTVSFLAAGQIQASPVDIDTYYSEFRIVVMTDNHRFEKTFDTSAAKLHTGTGRLSKFSLKMADAAMTERAGMSVVWSPGYLIYDQEASAYGFAGPDDPGLYFKVGSLCGFDFDSTVDPLYKYANSKYLIYYRYDTIADAPYPTNYDVAWEDGTANMLYYVPDGNGNIVPAEVPASYDAIDDYAKFENPGYDYAHDPCSYVKDGGYKWRMPTTDECNELIAIVDESISNWRSRSCHSEGLHKSDGSMHVMDIYDRNGDCVSLATTSYITHTNSVTTSGKLTGVQTYYVQVNSSYSAYIPTSNRTTRETAKEKSVYVDELSIQSFNCLREDTEASLKIITSSCKTSPLSQGATVIRCVRDRTE